MRRRQLALSAFWLALGLALPSPGRALTLAQLETQTRTLIRDTSSDTNFQRFSTSQIDSFLNEAHRQMQNDAWLYQGAFTMSLTSGTIEYALPTDYIATVRVTISSAAITQVSFQGLDQNSTNWTVATSTPNSYFIDSFVAGGASMIGFYPNPKFTATNAVFVQYVRQVPTLASATDVPFAGNSELVPYHDALADFAAARAWQLLGRPDLSSWLMALYASRTAEARANLNKQPNWLPGASGNRGPRQ